MASEFGAQIHEARHQLTRQLIRNILGLEPDDENFVLAHNFCLQKEYYHSFADVNPSAVEAFYADIVQRLQQNSQCSKAAALSALTAQLLAVDLQCSSTLELNHNILQLLASLAGQPLQSELEETPQLLGLLFKPTETLARVSKQHQAVAVSRFRQLLMCGDGVDVSKAGSSRADSEVDEYDPYGEESDLTSWASDDEQGQRQQQHPVATEDPLALNEASDSEVSRGGSSSSAAPAPVVYLPPRALQGPQQLQPCRATLNSSHLLLQLANKRLATLPFLCPDRNFCLTEQYLAQQLMQLLQGQQAHGFILTEPKGDLSSLEAVGPVAPQPCFTVDPRVTTPALSPGALHAIMTECAAAGSAARRLRTLAAQLTQRRGKAWLPGGAAAAGADTYNGESSRGTSNTVTSCLRAFGVALQLQLDLMGQQIAQLQQQTLVEVQTHGARSEVKSPGMTLLAVKQQVRPIMHRLHLLHQTASGVLAQLGGCPADVSATLLDGLCEAVNAAANAASGEQGVADAAALLQLLLCCCVPLVAALAQWLWSADDAADQGLCEPVPHSGLGQTCASARSSKTENQQHPNEGVTCCCEDFFVVKKAAVAATDARFWHAAYGTSRRRAGDSSDAGGKVACPAFLLPLVDRIMAAGKGVRLLDYMDQEQLRHTAFCSGGSSTAPALPCASGVWLGAAPTGPTGASNSAPRLARSSSNGCRPHGIHHRSSSSVSEQRGLKPTTSLSRQPSAKARRHSAGGADAAPAGAAAIVSQLAANKTGSCHSRKQWDVGAGGSEVWKGAAATQPNLAAFNLTRQVRLQLAVAVGAASCSQQEQLPHGFIQAASNLLQQHQQQQSSLLHDLGVVLVQSSGLDNNEPRTALQLMRQVLASAGNKLASPYAQLSRQTSQQQPPTCCLREALLAVKEQRAMLASQLGRSKQPRQQQQTVELQQTTCKKRTEQPPQVGSHQPFDDNVSRAVAQQSHNVTATPLGHANTDCADADMPRLLQWRDQLEARLTAAGTCLQNMAPWQRQQQQHCNQGTLAGAPTVDCQAGEGRHGSKAAIGETALVQGTAALINMPGSFSASLMELWPLQQQLEGGKSAAAVIRQWAAHCNGSSSTADQKHKDAMHWLAGGAWQADQLAWLLLTPPRQLLPLPQLLEQALLQPIQERLDWIGQQLLSSLMGEWGLLQQLQGLVGVFLLASPTVVEWSEGCFAAVEAAAAAKHAKDTPASSSASSNRVSTASAAPACRGGVYDVLGIEEVDVFELELLLHDLVSSAAPDDALPDASCLHIKLNTAALADLRTAKQQAATAAAVVLGSSGQSAAVAPPVLGVSGTAATGGLWGCIAEWAGLSCHHSGTWQLSLLYEPEELNRFSLAWRFLLQLRWVRRRLDGARHAACKGAAALHKPAEQDSQEHAAVAAAIHEANSGLGQMRAMDPATDPSKWLSSRQELLLLQEMGQLMARWQQYVMDRLLRTALPALEQALLSAGSLDEVRAAAGTFLCTVSNLCNVRPSGKGAGGTWRHVGKVVGQIMDSCLAAAAAAGSLRRLRLQLAQAGVDAAVAQRCWLELSGVRCRISGIATNWRSECGYLLRILSVRSQSLGDEDDLEALLGALDANGYYQRLAGLAGAARQ